MTLPQPKTAILRAKELRPLDPNGRYDPQRILEEAEWELLPANNRRPVRIRVNAQGSAAVAILTMQSQPDAGLAVLPASLIALAHNMRIMAELFRLRSMFGKAAVVNANRFADALHQAATIGGIDPVVMYRSTNSQSIVARARVLREELTHVEQFRKSSVTKRRYVEVERLTADAAWPVLKKNLIRDGYRIPDIQLIAEATAQLASGQATRLGVGQLDAIRFLTRYLEVLVELHGVPGAQEVLQSAEPWIRKELRLERPILRRPGLRQSVDPNREGSGEANER